MGKVVSRLCSIREGEQEIDKIFTEPLKTKLMNAAMQGKRDNWQLCPKDQQMKTPKRREASSRREAPGPDALDLVTWELVRRNKTCSGSGSQLSLNQTLLARSKGK